MSLLKPRIMTPARLAASHRDSQKSTGPRTARGDRKMPICPWNQTEAPTHRKRSKMKIAPNNRLITKGQKSAPNKLLKTKDDEKKDVKNEGCSQ